jgi:hypothetical protein
MVVVRKTVDELDSPNPASFLAIMTTTHTALTTHVRVCTHLRFITSGTEIPSRALGPQIGEAARQVGRSHIGAGRGLRGECAGDVQRATERGGCGRRVLLGEAAESAYRG